MVARESGPAHHAAPGDEGIIAAGKIGRRRLLKGGGRCKGNVTSEVCWRIDMKYTVAHALGANWYLASTRTGRLRCEFANKYEKEHGPLDLPFGSCLGFLDLREVAATTALLP